MIFPPVFKKIDITDADFFKKHIRNRHFNCDWAITNIFCWQDFYQVEWCYFLQHIVIRIHVNGGDAIGYMVHPLHEDAVLQQIIDILTQDAATFGQPLRLLSLAEDERELVQGLAEDTFFIDNNRDYEDYIYHAADLRNLKGAKYAAKRNHVNRFSAKYDWTYQPLTTDRLQQCLSLEAVWRQKHTAHQTETSAEQKAIKYAFDHFDELGLIGGALYADNEMIAFTYGSEINDETFCVHIEKANIEYEGVFSAINHLFVKHLPEKYLYINREDDLGLDGLRKSKLSYHPAHMEPKFTALRSDKTMHSIINLWEHCFDDDADYVATFLARYYIPDISILRKAGDEIIAMLFMIPFHSELGMITYIFGVSTLEKYRNQGLAQSMMNEAIEKCKKQKINNIILIPGNERLKDFYKKFGFIDADIPVEFIADFDFGTGNPDRNKAMLLPLNEQTFELPENLHCYYGD